MIYFYKAKIIKKYGDFASVTGCMHVPEYSDKMANEDKAYQALGELGEYIGGVEGVDPKKVRVEDVKRL